MQIAWGPLLLLLLTREIFIDDIKLIITHQIVMIIDIGAFHQIIILHLVLTIFIIVSMIALFTECVYIFSNVCRVLFLRKENL